MAKLAPIPDISREYNEYCRLNPAFDYRNNDKRGIHEMDGILWKNGDRTKPHTHNEVVKNLAEIREVMRAKIKQLRDNNVWRRKGGSSDQHFWKSPRTLIKTAQEILSHQAERMVFDRSEAEITGNFGKIIIDPRRISNTLLINLGLEEFIPEKGSSKEEKLKKYTEAIPAIQDMLTQLEPLQLSHRTESGNELNYFRMMRIGRGKNRGYILGTQHIDGNKKLFKTDTGGAQRRLLHIEKSYDEEIEKLKVIQYTLSELERNINDLRDEDLSVLRQLTGELINCVDELKHVKDADKKELRGKITKSLEQIEDGNIKDAGASINDGLEHIARRMFRIRKIRKELGEDKSRIQELIQGENQP